MRKMVFPSIVILVVVLIIFVLWITSRDPNKDVIHRYEKWINLHTDKTVFHYGIVIDCGSSGSRVFIYYWPPHSGNPHELLKLHQMMDHDNHPVRMRIKPGDNTILFYSVNWYLSYQPVGYNFYLKVSITSLYMLIKCVS